ncbi:MAG: AAA family ATPase, partial [Lactobacillaceae bacterium]|nr:AAA family ATPase [Lactobacillaceae bacterium]
MANKYTRETTAILDLAQENAKNFKHTLVGSEHLLVSIASANYTSAGELLNDFNITSENVNDEIKLTTGYGKFKIDPKTFLPYSPKAKEILDRAMEIATINLADEIAPEHLLFSILKDEISIAGRVLISLNVNPQDLIKELMLRFRLKDFPRREKKAQGNFDPTSSHFADNSNKPKQKLVEKYSRDLTKLAQQGKMETAIGRDNEIRRVIQILSRKTKNNPVLVGEPGVGKTAIIEGLAKLINENNVPDTLKNKRILSLDLTGLIAGTKFRGEFEERIKTIIDEV